MKPYSDDLRLRMFNYSLNHSIRETARAFRVSPNTVYLLTKRFNESGSLSPKTPIRHGHRAIPEEGEMHLRLWLDETPDLTLEELRDRYEHVYGVRVGITTLHNTLRCMRITRKRKTFRDPKRDTEQAEADRRDYDAKLATVAPEHRLYLDETGCCLNMTPAYGRSPQGQRAFDLRPASPGISVGTITLLSPLGMVAPLTYRGALNAPRLVEYLLDHILPLWEAGYLLIMDRLPVHVAQLTQTFLVEHAVNYAYLPPYSPDLNPIEEAFSKMKHLIKKSKPRTLDALMKSIKSSIASISQEDAEGYFIHAAEF